MNNTIKNILLALAAVLSTAIASVLTIYVTIDGYFPVGLGALFSFEFLLGHSPGVVFSLFWGLLFWGLFFFAIFFSTFRKALFRLFSPFKELVGFIGAFCREYKKVVVFLIILFVLCFGFEITNPTLSIDEEGTLIGGYPFFNWLTQGRLGNTLFKSFFQFHPLLPLFLSSFIGAAFWTISCLLWCAILFFRKDGSRRPDTLPLIIFCGLFMSMPTVIAEFMISGIYNIEVSMAMIFSAISIYCVTRFVESGESCEDGSNGASFRKKDRKYFYAALFPLTFAIAIYQSYVPVFITGTIAVLMCNLLHADTSHSKRSEESLLEEMPLRGKKDFAKWLSMIPPYVLALLISLASYYALFNITLAITNMQTSAYLDTFSGWASGEPFAAIFRNTLIQIFIHFFSSGYPGSVGMRLTAIVLAIGALLCVISFKGWRRPILLALCVFLGVSPFLLNLVLMGFMPLRAMQALPLMMGGAWYFLYHMIRRVTLNRAAVVLPCVVALMLVFGQVQTMNRLFYGAHLQYQMDRHIASMIMHDVKREFGEIPDVPIMFLGVLHQEPNPFSLPGGIVGRSFWDFDDTDNSRMTAFLRAIGYYNVPSNLDKREMEYKYRESMPIWPAPGSIIETYEGIMIRLS